MRHNQQILIPGIIGGLGSIARIEFERKLIEKKIQQDRRSQREGSVWLLVNATDVPDCAQSFLGKPESCVPILIKYGKALHSGGADFLIVTSSPAHMFYNQVQQHLPIPWIHLIDATSNFIFQNYIGVKKVGVLGTDDVILSGLYNQSLTKVGISSVSPSVNSSLQDMIMRAVNDSEWGIKVTGVRVSKQAISILETATDWLKSQGAEIAIAGCTELSVCLASLGRVPLPWIDPLDVLADITVNLSKG